MVRQWGDWIRMNPRHTRFATIRSFKNSSKRVCTTTLGNGSLSKIRKSLLQTILSLICNKKKNTKKGGM